MATAVRLDQMETASVKGIDGFGDRLGRHRASGLVVSQFGRKARIGEDPARLIDLV